MASTQAITAFREAYFDADTMDHTDTSDWADFDARKMRYAMLWAFFQGSVYRDIHTWARKMRADFGLYKYTRDLYNPAFQLGSFYQTYIWGGPLDADAGDGRETPSALPILTENELLRPAIAQLWAWSNWKTKRKLASLYGGVLGDVFLQVIDDTLRNKVYIKIVHPGIVRDLILDPFGNVKGYSIEYQRTDPESSEDKEVTYMERVHRVGDSVIFEMYKEGQPFDWDYDQTLDESGAGPQPIREIPYGFVPMVFIPHRDRGLGWGAAEPFNKLALFREVDDQASKLNDQVRKIVDSPWLFSGLEAPTVSPAPTGAASSSTRPEPGREEVPALYSREPGASAQPLVAPLDIGAVVANIQAMLGQLEKAYPELALYRVREGGDLSGRAIQLIQRDAESKVVDYRDAYDGSLVRAHQMAIAIGGFRELEAFKGFNLESFEAGNLDHQIGTRPVFAKDPRDELDLEAARLENLSSAVGSGIPLAVYMRKNGFAPDYIEEVINSEEYQAKLASMSSFNSSSASNG
jgi:hypothetical protein